MNPDAVNVSMKATNHNISSFRQIMVLLKKDLLLEIRQQYTLYGILLYIASTIFVLKMAMNDPEPEVWNGMFWVIQLFVCVNAVAKSFLQESRGRMLYYYSIAGAKDFIIAKLCFNGILMMAMSLLSLLVFRFFMGNPLHNPLAFYLIVCLGGFSLSLVFTFLAAIAARASQGAAILAILGFPLIIPQLLILMKISVIGFSDVIQSGLYGLIGLLLAFNVLVIALAIILFPYLWKD